MRLLEVPGRLRGMSMSEIKCAICKKPTTEDDHCFGCGEYVCGECDETEPTGRHSLSDHNATTDWDED